MERKNNGKTAIVVDAEYVERAAFDFIVNFERMLGRRIPPADLCDWLTCLVLDAGLRPGDHETDVSVLHEPTTRRLANWQAGGEMYDLGPFSFGNALGRFGVNSYAVEHEMTDKAAFFADSVRALGALPEVKRLLLVPDFDAYGRDVLAALPEQPEVTLFVPEPFRDRRCMVEPLGYSLAHALGIKGEELA